MDSRRINIQRVENALQQYLAQRAFFYETWLPFVQNTKPLLLNLAWKQYPLLAKNGKPEMPVLSVYTERSRSAAEIPVLSVYTERSRSAAEINQYLNIVTDNHCSRLINTFNKVLSECKNNMDIKNKYPKLEQWRQFYCNPEKPYLVTDEQRHPLRWPDDKEWKKHKTEENRKIRKIHRNNEKRRTQYYDIIQPRLLKYLPDLLNLEGDHWVIYAATLRDLYEEWKAKCDHADETIYYKMPPETLWLGYKEWDKQRLKHAKTP